MKGIHFVTDAQNKKIAVQIDLQRYSSIWEDFYDRLLVESRKNEETSTLGEFLEELKAENLLDNEV
ncbi:MAG: hypothetical protein AAF849_11495 [Bacteroidota bacterium]